MAQATAVGPAYRGAREADVSQFLARWLKVWVALLAVVVLVVVVYLIAITNSLADINGNLATANRAVVGAGTNVRSLPDQVDSINGSLASIDQVLKPIPGQADTIIASLTSIDGKLKSVDGSLKDTSGILTTVLGTVTNVENTLIRADQPNGACGGGTPCGPNQLGVQNIHQRVDNANRILGPAKGDADNIVGGLNGVLGSLRGICTNPLVQTLAATKGGAPC